MNYCILPKNNIRIDFFITYSEIIQNNTPYISCSTSNYLYDIISQLGKITDIDTKNNLIKLLNPHEYVNTIVDGYDISVSKFNYNSNFWFELTEIICSSDIIFNYLNQRDNLNIYIISTETDVSPFNLINENISKNISKNITGMNNDTNTLLEYFICNQEQRNIDFCIFSFNDVDYLDTNTYIINMLVTLQIIITHQTIGSSTIIKIDNICNKIIVEIIYIYASIYDKVCIIKPIVSNIMSNTRYLVCTHLNVNVIPLKAQIKNIIQPIIKSRNIGKITSILKNTIPIFFLNKLEDINVNITHQQLEAYDNIINLYKMETNDSKLEVKKRQNILKCIHWCEKYKIPHNKFLDKVNIFLHP